MRIRPLFVATLLALSFALSTSVRAQLYWDTNGAADGATDTDPDAPGIWDAVTSNWNQSADGIGAGTQTWVPDSVAVFAAGFDATGTYTVTIDGTVSASGVTFDDAFSMVTIAGGQLTLVEPSAGVQPTITVPSADIERITSVIGGTAGLISAGAGILELGGANTYAGATRIAAGNSIKLVAAGGAEGVIPDASVLVLENGVAGTSFQLNGFDETVASLSNGGTTGSPVGTIYLGTNTLTLSNPQGETNGALFSTAAEPNGAATGTPGVFTSPHATVIKNGTGAITVNGASGGFVGGEFIVNTGTVNIGQVNAFGTNANGSKLTINEQNDPTGPTLVNKVTNAQGNPTSLSLSVQYIDVGGSFTFDLDHGNDSQFIGSMSNVQSTLKTDNPTVTIIPRTADPNAAVFIWRGVIADEIGPDPQNPLPGRGFTKAGAGVLSIANPANTWRGETTIVEGVLRLTNETAGANVGVGRIGDGTGRVNLAGGTLSTNGAANPALANARRNVVPNPINITAPSSITWMPANSFGPNPGVPFDLVFSNSLTVDADSTGACPTPSSCKLTVQNVGSTAAASNNTTFRAIFTGGFSFSQDVDILNGSTGTGRLAELHSDNTSLTQTFSGTVGGNGSYRRTGAGGTTVFSGANTYSGGTTVEAGTLTVSGTAATLGTGNVSVTGGVLDIASGVANAIADTATLSITDGMANLGSGINELVAALTLGGMMQDPGTYGSSTSTAMFQLDQYFSGMGIITVPSVGLDGDYNGDGKVDAADYALWRSDPASYGGDPDGYNTWRNNFGAMAGSGAGSASSTAVPEPASLTLLALACALMLAGVRRAGSAD
jgi:autotransporter-associated beta strand protein